MNKFAVAFVGFLLTSCSNSPMENPYCRAVLSSAPTRELPVRDVYIYGTLEHGTILINPSCIQPVFNFYSFHESISPADGAAGRIREFNKKVYDQPAAASGLFKISGTLNVYPESRLIELYDLYKFKEVDEAEAKFVIGRLRQSRNEAPKPPPRRSDSVDSP
ncbi:hypothetical protein VA603_06250 [Stenotrophomonas sp. MH1]|uniref:Lipoprotein n=1 Tax=Stenotrophomonas capsici TaxID=3110230 RepID=A0ABU5V1C0_9GAMM|nr:hypothetical protein [Stenotrophomonas sp. MH1]MEA5667136.1 hypothetical protein [Stenotrophomonas sp. MH1]